jgi:hypothetical protein
MQTTTKQKPVAQPRHDRARLLGITDREYFALGKFSNSADKLGLKSTSIRPGDLQPAREGSEPFSSISVGPLTPFNEERAQAGPKT